jgi:hypothetical protein
MGRLPEVRVPAPHPVNCLRTDSHEVLEKLFPPFCVGRMRTSEYSICISYVYSLSFILSHCCLLILPEDSWKSLNVIHVKVEVRYFR